jgi:single-strand DNA-binding protein
MDICTISLTGRLTRDPELRTTGSGKTVANAGFATTVGKEETLFSDIAAWGRTGEILAQYAGKGDPLTIVGRPKLETFTTKAGEERTKLSITVDSLKLPSKSERQDQGDDDEIVF